VSRRLALVVAPAALVAAYVSASPGRSQAGRIALLALVAIVLGSLVSGLARMHERWPAERLHLPLRRRRPEPPLSDLARIEWTISAAVGREDDFRRRLAPLLRDVAGARLARVGADLDGDPERVHELLGDETWELVRPDRPEPEGRGGVSLAVLRRAVDRLEEL
jgi:hypothetical protein